MFSICGKKAENFLKGEITFKDLINTDQTSAYSDFSRIVEEAILNISKKQIPNINESNYIDSVYGKSFALNNKRRILSESEFMQHVISMSEDVEQITSNGQINFMKLITNHNIVRFLSNLTGKHGIEIDESLKIDLVNNFADKYMNIYIQLNVLTQYIWSDILMNLTDDKQQFVLSENIKEFDYSIIDKTLYDAIAYSEGIYQLIENSTIHTRFKNVILFIRNHNIRVKNSSYGKPLDENTIIKGFTKRKELKERIFPDSKKETKSYRIPEDVNNCLEIIVCDTAFSTGLGQCEGMVNTYLKKPDSDQSVDSISKIFNLLLNNENAYKHYGVQLFEKNVILNNGFFTLSTPHVIEGKNYYEEYSSCYIKNEKKQHNPPIDTSCDKTTCFTCYNVLLPLGYKWDEIQKKEFNMVGNSQRWFNESLAFESYPNYKTIEVTEIDKVVNGETIYSEIEQKDEVIEKLYKTISFVTSKRDFDDLNSIIVCNAQKFYYQHIELIAKALFEFAYIRRNKPQTLIAIYFETEYQINEFVRFFSVFYDKKGNIEILKNLQIALLLENNDTNNIPIVALVIAGANIEEAFNTSLMYSYSNSNVSVRFVDSCRYLTRVILPNHVNKPKYVPILPFDIFLNNGKICHFIQNLYNDIKNNDIRNKEYGCLIDNVHIRIGSKIHLDKFFEAELIFHNSNTINKFAYLIAIDIEEQLRQSAILDANAIMIVGYESYSSLLVQEVIRLLKHNNPEKSINYCIYSVNDKGEENVSYSPEVSKSKNQKELILDSLYFTIMPINTTFTTVYKMQNVIRRNAIKGFDINQHNVGKAKDNLKNIIPIEFIGHYSIIVVSQTADINGKTLLQDKYWRFDSRNQHNIILNKESNSQKEENNVLVKAYIVIDASWFNPPKEIEKINSDPTYPIEPLIYVDKTSTIPNALFKLKGTYLDGPDTYFKYDSSLNKYENDEETKINSLFDCLIYSHIYKKDNHFLYYIDKNKYCEVEKGSIIKWLSNEKNCIKNGDFNVIISPLHNPDSVFLKLVLDYGFSHNFRLIHMSIYETNQTELLSKFSYIAKQYEEIAKHNSAAKLNFYFVDNSIVTGKTIERSLSLIRSLISICGITEIIPIKFSKIFTLINRSRPHTISEYVENPHEDIHSYLYLHVPNFNTHNNNCPTCNLVKKYESLVKRSSTNCMSNEYYRLVEKHQIKSIEQYEKWLEYNIISSRGYYRWLKQWLYKYVYYFRNGKSEIKIEKDDRKIVIDLYKSILNKEKSVYKKCVLKNNDDLYNALKDYGEHNLLLLSDFSPEIQEKGAYIFKKYIQGSKNLIRLKTTHNMFNILNYPDDVEECERRIITSMKNEIHKNESWINTMEHYISYIKIVSRPILSQYYHIRCAVLNIIENFINIILWSESENDSLNHFIHPSEFTKDYVEIIEYIESAGNQNDNNDTSQIMHVVQYQFVLCLARRLTDLNSLYFLKFDNIKRIYTKWGQLRDNYSEYAIKNVDYACMNSFPNEDELFFNISKIIKWSSMSSDENSGNFLIQDLDKQIKKRGDKNEQ